MTATLTVCAALRLQTARCQSAADPDGRLSSSRGPAGPRNASGLEDRLLIDGEFVLRYETEHVGDGLPAGKGVFLACSFWLVDNYMLQGRCGSAQAIRPFALPLQ